MKNIDDDKLKCFEFICPLFPKCKRAVSCCAVDDFFEDVTIKKEECFCLNDKPLFKDKKK